jgi:hypothetical protein
MPSDIMLLMEFEDLVCGSKLGVTQVELSSNTSDGDGKVVEQQLDAAGACPLSPGTFSFVSSDNLRWSSRSSSTDGPEPGPPAWSKGATPQPVLRM